MFLPDRVIRSRRVLTPRGLVPAAIHVRRGRIIGVLDAGDVSSGCPVDDVGDRVVMPGLVDAAVHLEASSSWASSFEATTRAAAAGGVTTIVTMPFDGVGPVTSVAALRFRRAAADTHCFVDVGFWGGVVPGNQHDLLAMFDAGVPGFHCVFDAAGHPGYHAVSESELRDAMPALARLGVPLAAHAELPAPVVAGRPPARRTWRDRLPGVGRRSRRYATYLENRPRMAENDAVAILLRLCDRFRVPIHIAHLSSSDVLTPIFHARTAGLPIGAGTCPHYLFFAAEDIPDGAVKFKCAPPIRERANRELLWAALAGGIIQSIASDHQIAAGLDRDDDFADAGGGIASLHLMLPVVWTAASVRGYSLEQVARWMCQAPAQLVGASRKGLIDVGYDADLVVFDPDAELAAGARQLDHPMAPTPYDGQRLRGVVERTYVRGMCVHERGRDFPAPRGRFLLPRQYTGV